MNDPTTVNNSPQESNNQLEWFNTAGFIKESEKQYQVNINNINKNKKKKKKKKRNSKI